jgi:hypothetical protein
MRLMTERIGQMQIKERKSILKNWRIDVCARVKAEIVRSVPKIDSKCRNIYCCLPTQETERTKLNCPFFF